MHKGIFITGTDTGVGKTFVAEGLIRAVKAMGTYVCPMKPVESGCKMKKGELVPSDAMALIKAAGVDESIDLVNPYRMKNPLAPSVAAEIEGVAIKKKNIISAFNCISKKYDMVVVEGAGGIMVPVFKKYLFLDLAFDLKLPVIIVARPGLGTINHTLLTINALRNKGLRVLGVIINYAEKNRTGLPEKTNPSCIEKLGEVPILGTIPHLGTNKRTCSVFRTIAEKIIRAR